jgi:hypothetical protein
MNLSGLFKVLTLLDSLCQFIPLSLNHIKLEMRHELLNEESKFMSNNHDLSDLLRHVYIVDFGQSSPGGCQVNLDSS